MGREDIRICCEGHFGTYVLSTGVLTGSYGNGTWFLEHQPMHTRGFFAVASGPIHQTAQGLVKLHQILRRTYADHTKH